MKSDILKESFFLHRLSNLQALCSSTNLELPNALVFIPGLDGKQNKGSFMILKYLFQGSVGRDIYEASLDEDLDCLEEIVLLIQESSVSVFWSNAAKAVVGPILNAFPFVLEYCPTEEEEENVDQFEARKCEDFKRMMLESVPEGGVVGLPVPLGYDDVLDTENWPMLQSFAIDSVVCATGFFTSRYAVIDITETLDIMFCTIDGYYVEKAINVLQSNVLNHVEQVMAPLRNSHGPEQRQSIRASDVISPLQLLFEFGSLDTAFPVDPALQPVLYLGAEVPSHALGGAITNQKWNDVTVGSSLSAIIEACEPTTGMRWCRTYFLQRGKCLDRIADPEALVSNEEKNGDDTGAANDMLARVETMHARGAVIDRMEALHHKLCTSFRHAVMTVFSEHGDVLDAGGAVQEMMHSLMTGDGMIGGLRDVKLLPSECLKVHMDCMNAHGQLVGIEDVDDMGGQCWTYIRVSVHGIAGVPGSKETYAVATGDTFLFSSLFSSLQLQCPSGKIFDDEALSNRTHMQDAFCLTHTIPRTAFLLGPDVEEFMGRRFLTSTGSFHMISALGLGAAINTGGTGVVVVTVLTDHPSAPVLSAEMRLFSSGFVVEKLDKCFLPFLVSFGVHVKEMWTVDLGDCYRRALDSKCFGGFKTSSAVEVPEGLLVVLQCHNFADQKGSMGQEDDSNIKTVKRCIEYNMLDRILPGTGKVTYMALCLPSDASRHASALTEAHHAWRVAARMNDIPDNRGARDTQTPLPDAILGPFLAMIDAETTKHVVQHNSFDAALSDESDPFVGGTVQIPGSGYLTMRANFMKAENMRHNQPASEILIDGDGECKGLEGKTSGSANMWSDLVESRTSDAPKKHVVLVMGAAGSGVLVNASQVLNRLAEADIESTTQHNVSSTLIIIDLTLDFPERVVRDGIADVLARRDSDNVVVAIITSAVGHVSITSVISKLEAYGCSVSYSIAVIAAQSTEKFLRSHDSIMGLGFETWAATGKELLCCGVADFVMFIEQGRAASSSSLDELFRSLNLSSISARMQPGQLWLDAETIDAIVKSLANSRRGISKSIDQRLNSTSFVTRVPHVIPGYRGLHSLRIGLPSSSSRWDVEKLVIVMKQILFPAAAVSNTCPDENWTVPPNKRGLVGMARSIELAKVKVFSSRQSDIGRVLFADYVSTVKDSPLVSSLLSGVISVHAALTMKDSTDANIFMEATEGAVIIRKWTGDLTLKSSRNVVCLQGVFSDNDLHLLEELIWRCTPYSLPEKNVKAAADLTPDEKKQIQMKHSDLPVPEGWWFDGASFVDVHGKRCTVRPDTEHLHSLFVEEQNEDIIKYNKLLREVKPFL